MNKRLEKLKQVLTDEKAFAGFLAAFFITQLVIVLNTWSQPLIWDSSVYVGMGKRLFSSWQFGIWELFRPLTLPLLLGTLWKAGIPMMGVPRLVGLLISTVGLTAMYWAIKDLFGRKHAFYSTAILMSALVFYKYSHYALTGIPSALLIFGAVYYAQKDYTFSSGILSSLAFLTRFPTAMAAPGIGIYLLVKNWKEEQSVEFLKPAAKFSTLFFVTALPFFVFNHIMYGNFFQPLIQGASIPTMNPDTYFYGIYFALEAVKTQPLFLLAIPGFYVVLKNRDWRYGAFFSTLVFLYGFFTFYPHKEPRFMLAFLPLLAVFAGLGVKKLEEREFMSKKNFQAVAGILLVVWMLGSFSFTYTESAWTNQERVDYLKEVGDLNGTVVSNSPHGVLYGDFELVPIRPENIERIYRNSKGQADYYAINSCQWYCSPAIDQCEAKQENFTRMMEKSYEKTFELQGASCNYNIYGAR